MQACHIPALCAIERACFSTPWSAASLCEELTNPLAVFLVAVSPTGAVAGYAGMHRVAGEGFLANVAVAPSARRQGVARALVTALMAAGAGAGLCRLTLEVRVSNAAAIALYEGIGFVREGVRPGFYRAPTEDAALYSFYF